MFETESFRRQIEDTVGSEAGRSGMERYSEGIAEFLQKLASDNESILMDRELRKTAAERRGIPDALESVRVLTREASRYAAEERRTTVQLADFQKAQQTRFCQVWPFCRS